MKKVLAALVMVLGTGSSVVFAQEVNNSSAIVAEAQVPQDEFVLKSATSLTKCYRLKRNVLLIRNPPIQSARPFQCAYHPLTP